MAELDYAYLADFAAVQDGKISAIGASFTHVQTPSFPAAMTIGIAGRIRAHVGEGPVQVNVKVSAPDDSFDLELSGMLAPGDQLRPYGDGKVGLLFALNTQVPLLTEGLYTFDILVNGEEARRLAFDVETTPVS